MTNQLAQKNAAGHVNLIRPEELEDTIRGWLAAFVAETFNLPQDEIDCELTFECYGMDSPTALGLSAELGDWLRYPLEPTIAYEHTSINALAKALGNNHRLRDAVLSHAANAPDRAPGDGDSV